MVIEGHWENERDDEEQGEDGLIMSADKGQGDKVKDKDGDLGRDDVDRDGPDEETVLALEQRAAHGAVMFYLERRLDYRRPTAHGTSESKAAYKYC